MSLLRVVTALMLVAASAGCGQSAPAQTPSGLLITADDLPAGFAPIPPLPASAIDSDRQECADLLETLETRPADDPGIVEQRVLFGDVSDNRVQEVVRAYPDADAADTAFGQATAVLPCCAGPFTLRFRDDGTTLTETVAPVDPGATRNSAWAAEITATGQHMPSVDRLTLLRRGPTLAIVSVPTSFGQEPGLIDAAVGAADRRLAEADGGSEMTSTPASKAGPGCAAGAVRA